MPVKEKLPRVPSMTTMYSINKDTGVVVVHRLPYKQDSPNLEHYIRKGFTFERPAIKLNTEAEVKREVGSAVARKVDDTLSKLKCDTPGCGFVAKTEVGLSVHKRKHDRSKK